MATINSLEEFREILAKDLKDYGENICKNLAKDITDILTDEARTSIESFYSYSPRYYLRHDKFNYSFRRDYKNRNPRFHGGVELLVDKIPDIYTGTNSSPESVFERVYHGYHGIASYMGNAPIMAPSPLERIIGKRDEIYDEKERYIDIADNKAQKQKYEILFQ